MHHHPGLARLAAGSIGRDEYCRFLARSYGFYAMVEPVAGLPGRLTGCLVRDLADLGLTAAAISALPRCMTVKIADGHSEMIGARYVLLGASLGGKVMAKAIARQHGGNAKLPTWFLTGSGDNDWKGFVSELEAALPDVASRSRAALAANATFAAYEEWMACNE
jgi:heme oxygenase